MKNTSVRIEHIEINNFKNVKHGVVDFKNNHKQYSASVLGLYGQNGSGKTALIDVVELLKLLLSGRPIPEYYADFINVEEEFANIKYTLKICENKGASEYKVGYEFCIRKEADNSMQNIESESAVNKKYKTVVFDEVLSFSYHYGEKKTKFLPLVDTRTEEVFLPKNKYKALIGNKNEVKTNMLSYKKLTASTSRSFLFSGEFLNVFKQNCNDELYLKLFDALVLYGNFELFVINTSNSGLISLNALPISFKYEGEKSATSGSFMLKLNEPTNIPKDTVGIVKSVISNMSIVLKQVIPGLIISLKELGTGLDENGNTFIITQLVSNKNSKEIPFRYESEGIKKIVSILHLLISVYNNSSITVAIDEMDSGVFEYLLGELLRIISEKGKGQLIFTSHDLRPLETLDKGFVAFTTTNPNNRFIRLSNVKANNNLRDFYYRDIVLGEQTEQVYEPTNNYEIALAFREAGVISGS